MLPTKSTVLPIENFEIAESVIRSLRSTSNAQRYYQQSTIQKNDHYLINDVDSFNAIISRNMVEVEAKIVKEKEIQRLIETAVVNKHSADVGISLPSKVIRSPTDDEDDDFSDDENKEEKYKDRKPNQQIEDDDLRDLIGSDEEDNILFKDFVAPSKSGNNNLDKTYTDVGIRGLQKNRRSSNGEDLISSCAKRGITIKAGQAIRVKPIGNRIK